MGLKGKIAKKVIGKIASSETVGKAVNSVKEKATKNKKMDWFRRIYQSKISLLFMAGRMPAR